VSSAKSRPSVYLLGAGASYGYAGSGTRVNPPLATTYFRTFRRLLISQDLEVKMGSIINYVRDIRGISVESMVTSFDENIESLFAELHRSLNFEMERAEKGLPLKTSNLNLYSLSRAYDQFIFWFAHVLNEIQNGARPQSTTDLSSRQPLMTPSSPSIGTQSLIAHWPRLEDGT
jgi:hypothetical protein